MKFVVPFGVLLFFSACFGPKQAEISPRPQTDASNAKMLPPPEIKRTVPWPDSVLASLSLRQKAAQLFIVWTRAGFLPERSEQWQNDLRAARDLGVGGFYLSYGTADGFAVNANALQSVASVPLLMSADFEWGTAMRIREATMLPRPMAIGAARDTMLAYRMGKAVAREAKALGIRHVYSPVADVNTNPKNPVINTRSFGEDAVMAGALAAAYVRGMEEEHVIATAKHFPGHGDTETDTHLDMPTLRVSKARFDSVELRPFHDAVTAGIRSVMTSHIHVPAYESVDTIPATLSSSLLTGVLRERWNFRGLIITDALSMRGVSRRFTPGDAAVRALQAGVDLLLMSPNIDEAIDSVVAAVKSGRLTEARIDSSVLRVLRAKQWCGLDTARFVDVNGVAKNVSNPEILALSDEIARRSVTVLGNESGILPLRDLAGKKVLDIVLSDTEDPEGANDLHDLLFERKKMELVRLDPRSNAMEFDDAMKKAKQYDIILTQFRYSTRSADPRSGFLSKKVEEFLTALSALKKPVIAVSLGNPYVAMEFPKTAAYVAVYGDGPSSIISAAQAIFGEIPAGGTLPVTIPGLYNRGEGVVLATDRVHSGTTAEAGMSADSLAAVDRIIADAIADSAFPGAVLLVARNGVIVHHKAYGKFTYDRTAERMTTDAIFDMASVSKVISTTSAVMKLVEEKRIALEDRVVNYFPAFGQRGKDSITIYNLMVHNSGLPAWRKFYEICDAPQCVMDSLFATPLVYHTGDSTIYSDLGLITMGKIVEKVTGKTLAAYVDSVFFGPLGMKNTMYNPPRSLWKRVVPTEIDSFWKKTYLPVRGRVHDENAATLGGISGHAGIFSTAEDLAAILQMELNGGTYGGRRYLDSATIARFIKQQGESSRAIGWDTRSTGRSFSGQFTSARTFLHTGFTGTSVVVDPEKNVIVVFLTNRVCPTRNNGKLGRVRPAVHDAVFRSIVR